MLYHSKQTVNQILLDELWEHRNEVMQLTKAEIGQIGESDYRNTLVAREIAHPLYNEICEDIQKVAQQFYNQPKLTVNQFDYLVYLKGMYFKPHEDVDIRFDDHHRKYTTITMMYKSEDFSGGQLKIEIDGEEVAPMLNVGHTLMFPSEWTHWVEPVESGRREVLVAWLN